MILVGQSDIPLIRRIAVALPHCGMAVSHADVRVACLIAQLHLRLPEVSAPGQHPGLQALGVTCKALCALASARMSATETMPQT